MESLNVETGIYGKNINLEIDMSSGIAVMFVND